MRRATARGRGGPGPCPLADLPDRFAEVAGAIARRGRRPADRTGAADHRIGGTGIVQQGDRLPARVVGTDHRGHVLRVCAKLGVRSRGEAADVWSPSA